MSDPFNTLREKVARAICEATGYDPNERLKGDVKMWSGFEDEADAAIDAVLKGLAEIDLPNDAFNLANHRPAAFRETLRVILTKIGEAK